MLSLTKQGGLAILIRQGAGAASGTFAQGRGMRSGRQGGRQRIICNRADTTVGELDIEHRTRRDRTCPTQGRARGIAHQRKAALQHAMIGQRLHELGEAGQMTAALTRRTCHRRLEASAKLGQALSPVFDALFLRLCIGAKRDRKSTSDVSKL